MGDAMTEDPAIIRRNIRWYRQLLKLYSTPQTRRQLQKMLADARVQLSIVVAKPLERKRQVAG
jgi:hypothetical protein